MCHLLAGQQDRERTRAGSDPQKRRGEREEVGG